MAEEGKHRSEAKTKNFNIITKNTPEEDPFLKFFDNFLWLSNRSNNVLLDFPGNRKNNKK